MVSPLRFTFLRYVGGTVATLARFVGFGTDAPMTEVPPPARSSTATATIAVAQLARRFGGGTSRTSCRSRMLVQADHVAIEILAQRDRAVRRNRSEWLYDLRAGFERAGEAPSDAIGRM